MAWSISITSESWAEIREQLETWGREKLIGAITDDTFEMVFNRAGEHQAQRAAGAERQRLESLLIDLLADRASELAEQTNTCDNGGFAYWIDREGYHKVHLRDEKHYWGILTKGTCRTLSHINTTFTGLARHE